MLHSPLPEQAVPDPMEADARANLRAQLKKHLTLIIGDDEPAFALELLGDYMDTALPLVEKIRAGFRGGDLTLLARSAHTLKSSSGALGAKGLQRACETLEFQAQAGSTMGLPELVRTVERSFEAFEAVVRAEMEELESRI